MSTRLLTLIRHAKASVEQRGGGGDFERALAPRGERDVVRMGKRLATAGSTPDLIVSSAALRADQTARAIAVEIGHPLDQIVTSEDLYLASERYLLDSVRATDPAVRHLALVGHNPGLSDLWGWLTDDYGTNLPTCGIARLELETESWREVIPGCALLVDFDYPKRASE